MSAQVVSANRLDTGRVVYLAPDGQWIGALSEAEVARDRATAERLLRRAEGAVIDRRIVAPYLIDVTAASAAPQPQRLRERIRATGPTIGPATPTLAL
ncbi:MAG: DUF2849 domain-containing protein [Alphaproteobacteria bacterium]